MEHVNIHRLSDNGVGLPADHSRGKRACLPYCVDATSHIDQFFQSIDMHFADFYISFPELRVTYNQGLVLRKTVGGESAYGSISPQWLPRL